MSKPALGPATRPSLPVDERLPSLAGAWMATWSSVASMSNSVVAVFASRSLFVYAAALTPVAAVVSGG